MTPDPSNATHTPFATGGEGNPAREEPQHSSRAGWIPCAICSGLIGLDEYRTARCWTDPNSITVAAHQACLTRVGEQELNLPPDPGEHPTATDRGERHEHASGFRVVDSP